MKKNIVLIALMVVWAGLSAVLSENYPYSTEYYKQYGTKKLQLQYLIPQTAPKENGYPCIVFYFGGGWNAGNLEMFRPHAERLVKLGMVCILVEYRTKSSDGVTPFECITDAKSSIRYIRDNASKFNIDPHRICASGGSAGGHLAAACAFITAYDSPTDKLSVSAVPDALVLFNPVIDNSPGGYANNPEDNRIGDAWPTFSPMHNIKAGAPPTIFLLGTGDIHIPVATGEKYKTDMEAVGSRCDLKIFYNATHGFFNADRAQYNTSFDAMVRFLKSIKYIDPCAEE